MNPILILICAFVGSLYLFLFRRPKSAPPGPILRLPMLGQSLYSLVGDRVGRAKEFRKRYGDVFCHDQFGDLCVTVCDLEGIQELFNMEASNARFVDSWPLFKEVRGGTGLHGLIFSKGI